MLSAHRDDSELEAICIDDSVFERKLNDRVFRRAGEFSVVRQFPTAVDALDFLRSRSFFPDAIFLDINMPLMNGFEFLSAATNEFGKKFTSSVVIMLTTSLNPQDRQIAEGFEAVKYFISKPLTVEEIREIVSGLR